MSMLDRFSLSSIAQSIKDATNQLPEYNKEDVDNAIAQIKQLGKRAAEQQENSANASHTHGQVAHDIKSILKLMKQFEGNLYVQRVSCHALSNLAMQVVIARYIVANNGFQHIRNALNRFTNDHKLCWLASSAIWNMARPPANRETIGKAGVKLMLKVLSIHHVKHEKVTNTAIGALSNLSLCEDIKKFICKKQNISLVLDVLSLYSSKQHKSMSVMTSGAGLLANLAVSDEHAETLLKYDAVPVVCNLLQWKSDNEEQDVDMDEESSQRLSVENTLHRNACAALNNMVTAPEFIHKILDCNGIETIYSFIKHTKNSMFLGLLNTCLTTLECDKEHPVSTMHLCGLHNRIDLLKKMIEKINDLDSELDLDESSDESTDMTPSVGSHIWGDFQAKSMSVTELLNKKDGNNMTVLQYAALGKHYKLVEFLIKCGADSESLGHEFFESTDESEDDIRIHQDRLNNAINKGKQAIESIQKQHQSVIQETLDYVPTDLCNLISTFENQIDMLQIAKQFK